MAKDQVFERKNILVIGGAGFIGSHLCDVLVKKYNVICIDNFVTSVQSNIAHLLRLPQFTFIRHDMNTPIVLEDIQELQKYQINVAGIDQVYNLACPTSPKNFEKHKIATVLSNSVGVRNALDLALKYKARFLQASSSVVYGGAEEGGHIFSEKELGCIDQMAPRACYDEGKRFAETITQTYADSSGLDVRIARIFRTYGPRMPLSDGQMIPDFITNALDNKSLSIFGAEDFTSSFCYVSDVVGGMVKLMDSSYSEPVNIGATENYLIKDVAQHIIDLVQSDSEITFKDPLMFMRPLGLPDISRAKEVLGWFPIVTISEGLKRTIDYTIANKGLVGFQAE